MSLNTFGRLKTPPAHPDKPNAMEIRENAIEQSVETMPDVDKQYMYERLKRNQHVERVTTAFLKLIRKYDFLPKRVLLEAFQDAVKHIYSANEQEAYEEQQKDLFVENAENLVKKLEEDN
tara:strand:+ start:57 stop:416 length:360 start_codon:yes stop_codon:yes gene_type:complete